MRRRHPFPFLPHDSGPTGVGVAAFSASTSSLKPQHGRNESGPTGIPVDKAAKADKKLAKVTPNHAESLALLNLSNSGENSRRSIFPNDTAGAHGGDATSKDSASVHAANLDVEMKSGDTTARKKNLAGSGNAVMTTSNDRASNASPHDSPMTSHGRKPGVQKNQLHPMPPMLPPHADSQLHCREHKQGQNISSPQQSQGKNQHWKESPQHGPANAQQGHNQSTMHSPRWQDHQAAHQSQSTQNPQPHHIQFSGSFPPSQSEQHSYSIASRRHAESRVNPNSNSSSSHWQMQQQKGQGHHPELSAQYPLLPSGSGFPERKMPRDMARLPEHPWGEQGRQMGLQIKPRVVGYPKEQMLGSMGGMRVPLKNPPSGAHLSNPSSVFQYGHPTGKQNATMLDKSNSTNVVGPEELIKKYVLDYAVGLALRHAILHPLFSNKGYSKNERVGTSLELGKYFRGECVLLRKQDNTESSRNILKLNENGTGIVPKSKESDLFLQNKQDERVDTEPGNPTLHSSLQSKLCVSFPSSQPILSTQIKTVIHGDAETIHAWYHESIMDHGGDAYLPWSDIKWSKMWTKRCVAKSAKSGGEVIKLVVNLEDEQKKGEKANREKKCSNTSKDNEMILAVAYLKRSVGDSDYDVSLSRTDEGSVEDSKNNQKHESKSEQKLDDASADIEIPDKSSKDTTVVPVTKDESKSNNATALQLGTSAILDSADTTKPPETLTDTNDDAHRTTIIEDIRIAPYCNSKVWDRFVSCVSMGDDSFACNSPNKKMKRIPLRDQDILSVLYQNILHRSLQYGSKGVAVHCPKEEYLERFYHAEMGKPIGRDENGRFVFCINGQERMARIRSGFEAHWTLLQEMNTRAEQKLDLTDHDANHAIRVEKKVETKVNSTVSKRQRDGDNHKMSDVSTKRPRATLKEKESECNDNKGNPETNLEPVKKQETEDEDIEEGELVEIAKGKDIKENESKPSPSSCALLRVVSETKSASDDNVNTTNEKEPQQNLPSIEKGNDEQFKDDENKPSSSPCALSVR